MKKLAAAAAVALFALAACGGSSAKSSPTTTTARTAWTAAEKTQVRRVFAAEGSTNPDCALRVLQGIYPTGQDFLSAATTDRDMALKSVVVQCVP
jgi:ABC-type glycerol-3-phosphate transport system substrate-binding protein